MRWLLAGYFGLALITISVAQNHASQVTQKPRFYGTTIGRHATIFCEHKTVPITVEWYKAAEYNVEQSKRIQISNGGRIEISKCNLTTCLFINKLLIEDSGVYFCKINSTWGPGTGLLVSRPINLSNAQHRTNMKDGLIILQGLLLAVCIASILLRKQKLLEKRDSIYEEPETDHIYEGLAIETCGGGLYEELSIYAQAEGTEAPWE